jgi:hypothetical protein
VRRPMLARPAGRIRETDRIALKPWLLRFQGWLYRRLRQPIACRHGPPVSSEQRVWQSSSASACSRRARVVDRNWSCQHERMHSAEGSSLASAPGTRPTDGCRLQTRRGRADIATALHLSPKDDAGAASSCLRVGDCGRIVHRHRGNRRRGIGRDASQANPISRFASSGCTATLSGTALADAGLLELFEIFTADSDT